MITQHSRGDAAFGVADDFPERKEAPSAGRRTPPGRQNRCLRSCPHQTESHTQWIDGLCRCPHIPQRQGNSDGLIRRKAGGSRMGCDQSLRCNLTSTSSRSSGHSRASASRDRLPSARSDSTWARRENHELPGRSEPSRWRRSSARIPVDFDLYLPELWAQEALINCPAPKRRRLAFQRIEKWECRFRHNEML
jgi:hypothetical protein